MPNDRVDLETIGGRISWARDQAGIRTRRELSTLLAVTEATAQRWERGEAVPSSGSLPALARALGVSVVWILTGEGKQGGEAA